MAYSSVALLTIGLLAVILYIRDGNGTPELYLGLTLDLLITVPFVYWLLIRRTSIPKTTVVPVFVLGVVIATHLVPDEHAVLLSAITTYLLPAVELLVATIVVLKVRRALKLFRAAKSGTADATEAIRKVSLDLVPGRPGALIASELTVLYYAFVPSRKPSMHEGEFTIHKHSGTVAVLFILALVVVVETVAVHVLLQMWSTVAAWILTVLSLYALIQIIAVVRSLSRRPTRVSADGLHLAYGLYADCRVDINFVAGVEVSNKPIDVDAKELKLSPLQDLEKHNVFVHFKTPQTVSMMYGFKKRCKTIALYVDEPQRFVETLHQEISR